MKNNDSSFWQWLSGKIIKTPIWARPIVGLAVAVLCLFLLPVIVLAAIGFAVWDAIFANLEDSGDN